MNEVKALEAAARQSYGRLLAFLAARTRDVATAEDALADAFEAALAQWPVDGVPDRPEAWLLTTARRRIVDLARRSEVRDNALERLTRAAEEAAAIEDEALPDERLRLLFVCAHPAIDPAVRTPLMLQIVLGLDAARIASAMLVSPTAMAQRLVRAKARIRDAGVSFEVPERAHWPERMEAVLEAIYAAYSTGWDDAVGNDPTRRGLTDEAVFLARLCATLVPADAEAHALHALVVYCESRRAARRSPDGAFVPLADQDVALWSLAAIAEADRALHAAGLALPPRGDGPSHIGRFHLEAAIQSVHARRAYGEPTDWPAIVQLYGALVAVAPTIGARVGRAAALGEAGDPAAGLDALDAIPAVAARAYQPYHAVRAALSSRAGRHADARDAALRAIGLSEDPAVRAFLAGRYPGA